MTYLLEEEHKYTSQCMIEIFWNVNIFMFLDYIYLFHEQYDWKNNDSNNQKTNEYQI